MDPIFINSENGKKSEPYRLLINLADKIGLKIIDKYFSLSKFSMYYTW